MTLKTAANTEDLLMFRLFRTHQVLEAMFSQEAASVDITPRQLLVLVVVARCNSLNQNELVENTGIDRSTLSDIVRRLVRKGFLHRQRSEHDQRAYSISLTSEGDQILARAVPIAHRAEQLFLKRLTSEQQNDISNLVVTESDQSRHIR